MAATPSAGIPGTWDENPQWLSVLSSAAIIFNEYPELLEAFAKDADEIKRRFKSPMELLEYLGSGGTL